MFLPNCRLAPCLVALLLPLGAASLARAAEYDSRPNILWLIGEDMGPEQACYGTPEVYTPVLDRLAQQGVRYARAFTVTPVCSTSRSSFMTGMYASTIGAHNHRTRPEVKPELPQGVRLITHWLRDAGYFTANVRTFPRRLGVRGTGKTDWNFKFPGKAFDSDKWNDLKSHQPFFAQVNFSDSHRGFNAPEQADPAKVVLPPYYPDHPVVRRDWAAYLDEISRIDEHIGIILGQLAADGLADNTIVVFMGDHGRAHVRGKQWCYDSGLRVPLIIRWPAGFDVPDGFRPGSVDERLIASIDVSATLLDAAGVKKPEKMQGRVFLGPRAESPRQYAFATRDRCDETVFHIRTVRDGRYRYIRNFLPERPFLQRNDYKERSYPAIAVMRELHAAGKLTPAQAFLLADRRPAEELYDLENDPWEIHNLAGSKDPEIQMVRKRLATALAEWISASGDRGQKPEDPAEIEFWQKRAEARRAAREGAR